MPLTIGLVAFKAGGWYDAWNSSRASRQETVASREKKAVRSKPPHDIISHAELQAILP